jgi:hypothetical protein
VTTHQLVLAVLGAADTGGRRRAMAAELRAALARSGLYRGSAEELTPLRKDPRTAVPVLLAAAATLVSPAQSHRLVGSSVASYALAPSGWERLLRTPPVP